jgi:DNA polymerase I-like protein with 3'-5' exonuclease and polymerase domains
MPKVIAIDYETYYDNQCSVREMIAEEYCADERFDAYMLSVYDGENKWVGHPSEFDWPSLNGQIIVAHNARFELAVTEHLQTKYPTQFPKFTPAAFHCTANLTSYLCNQRALDSAAKELYGEYVSKGARTDMKGKYWHQIDKKQQDEMSEYAINDVLWCRRFFVDHIDKWPLIEQKLAELTIRQGRRGVKMNADLLQKYLTATLESIEETKNKIPWVQFGKAPSSSQAVAWQCRKDKIDCPPVKGEDEEGYAAWQEQYRHSHPWVELASSYRSLTKLLSVFQKVERRMRPEDDTMPFGLKYFGAHTGRWAGDSGVNMQNPRKESVLINQKGLMETNEKLIFKAFKEEKATGKLPSWVKDEINFRHLIVPRNGKKMIASDLSQIEPRVLAWLVDDAPFLEQVRSGQSPYEAHARTSDLGWTGGKLKEENPDLYALAKARVLALGYGAGWKKFITMALNYGLDITKDDPEFIDKYMGDDPKTGEPIYKQVSGYGEVARQTVKAFREGSPLIADYQDGLWYQLDGDLKRSVGEDYVMTLPTGREMRYRKVQRVCRTVADEEGKPKGRWEYTAKVGFRRMSFYGGKLCENLVQATAREVFGEHVIDLDNTGGVEVLFTCHDEAVTECDPDITAKDIAEIMSRCPEWLKGCPIAADATELEHYTK